MDFLTVLKALLLGVLEGLTEFLPVSSTGHLIVASDLLAFRGPQAKLFVIVIQLGAILAIVWEYRPRFYDLATRLASEPHARRLALNLAIGLAPAMALGALLHGAIKTHLFSPVTVAAALVAGGLVILWVERRQRIPRVLSVDELAWHDALKVGFAQSLAMFPGVSRSGATIVGGMLFGLSRETATLFSFFLAVPTMLAAVSYDLYSNRGLLVADGLGVLATGFAAAFVAALLTARALVAYVARHDFRPFAWYRIAFGIAVLATWATGMVEWRDL